MNEINFLLISWQGWYFEQNFTHGWAALWLHIKTAACRELNLVFIYTVDSDLSLQYCTEVRCCLATGCCNVSGGGDARVLTSMIFKNFHFIFKTWLFIRNYKTWEGNFLQGKEEPGSMLFFFYHTHNEGRSLRHICMYFFHLNAINKKEEFNRTGKQLISYNEFMQNKSISFFLAKK